MPQLPPLLRLSSISRFFSKRNISSDKQNYESALKTLNDLQSNAATISRAQNQGPVSHVQQAKKVEETTKYLSRIGISLEALDKLSVIHIAGTKGKGTTAALCESILRQHGYRTGFYSSPHLVEVRERIRLNGVPLSHQQFADYLNEVHRLIDEKRENEMDMPAYFKFLTVMAFHVFLREQVDVAVIEVGIGGEYDCTNCIRKPAVVGITTLGLDHTTILGKSLADVAWQKAGIMKTGTTAFTVPQPSPAATDVLLDRAHNRQCSLFVVPPLETYSWEQATSIAFPNVIEDVYTSNASLALQLANEWLKQQSPFIDNEKTTLNEDCEVVPVAKPFKITHKMAVGMERCSWPGRTQILHKDNITYFLDGAHTEESIEYCMRWFQKASIALQTETEAPRRVLIFNTTGSRDNTRFLDMLNRGAFDSALFPTIIPFVNITSSSDYFSKRLDDNMSLENLSSIWSGLSVNNHSQILTSVSEAIESLKSNPFPCHVLVTGSVHLVGCVLAILDPELSEPTTRASASLKPLHNLYTTIQAVL